MRRTEKIEDRNRREREIKTERDKDGLDNVSVKCAYNLWKQRIKGQHCHILIIKRHSWSNRLSATSLSLQCCHHVVQLLNDWHRLCLSFVNQNLPHQNSTGTAIEKIFSHVDFQPVDLYMFAFNNIL